MSKLNCGVCKLATAFGHPIKNLKWVYPGYSLLAWIGGARLYKIEAEPSVIPLTIHYNKGNSYECSYKFSYECSFDCSYKMLIRVFL